MNECLQINEKKKRILPQFIKQVAKDNKKLPASATLAYL